MIRSLFRLTILFLGTSLLVLTSALLLARHEPAATAWLLFVSNRYDFDHELFRILPNGSGERRLTHIPGPEHISTWTADGRWFYFQTLADGVLYRMTLSGSEIQRVSRHRATFETWLPDQEYLIISMNNSTGADLYRIDPDGRNPVNLTNMLGSERNIRWSPDGGWLLFDSTWNNNLDLFQLGVESKVLIRITDGIYMDRFKGWSPDSKWIIVDQSVQGKPDYRFIRVSADGLEITPLLLSSRMITFQSLSPDGEWLLWTEQIPLNPAIKRASDGMQIAYKYVLFRTRSDGSERQTIIDDVDYQRFLSWSEDGAWLLVGMHSPSSLTSLPTELYRIRPDGTDLTYIGTQSYQFLWQLQTGDYIWLDLPNIYRMDSHTLTPKLVAVIQTAGAGIIGRGHCIAISPSDDWILCSFPTEFSNSALFRVDIATGDIHLLTESQMDNLFEGWSPIIDLNWQPVIIVSGALLCLLGEWIWLTYLAVGEIRVSQRKSSSRSY